MRSLSRRGIAGAIRGSLRRLALAALVLLVPALASARDVAVTGTREKGFGRILLEFDAPTKVQVKNANSVLVIGFAEPARIKTEKLASEIGAYVAVVRRDPDGTGLRLALQLPYRVSVLEAGEKVFVDLLPQNWSGLPPSLPPGVVADLAERVRKAEEKARNEVRRAVATSRQIRLEGAALPTLSRLAFASGADLPRVRPVPDGLELVFPGPATLDETGVRPKLLPGIASFETRTEGDALVVAIGAAPPYEARAFADGDMTVVDLQKPPAAATPPPVAAAPAAPPIVAERPAPPAPGKKAEPAPAMPEPAPAPAMQPAAAPSGPAAVPPSRPSAAPGIVTPTFRADADGRGRLTFPFTNPTPAAAFERAGILTLVFETADRLGEIAGRDAPRPLESRADAGLMLLRFEAAKLGAVSLVPDGAGWALAPAAGTLPPDALRVGRALDESGQGQVTVSLAGASRAFWLAEPGGTRLAVVTATGRVQNVPLPRIFVEFELPATLHGVVVEARADDLVVSPSAAGVSIGRGAGLAISPPGRGGRERDEAGPAFVLARDPIFSEGSAAILPRYQELVADSASAPRSGQAEARYRLARFLIGAGLNQEAAGIMAIARADDNVFRQRRETSLLSGIAAIRADRIAEGRRFLAPAVAGDDAEAAIWRAVADSKERRWPQALAGFRRAGEILDRYPDEIAGWVRLRIVDAALGTNDVARAESEIAAIDRLPTGAVARDEHDLVRARVDEAAGRADAAARIYGPLAESAGMKVSAEARLRSAVLAAKSGAITRDEAIERLETLSIAWRGDTIEMGTIDELARFYGEAGRWREMFAMSRRANRLFPNDERTRALHERSAALLESLILGPQGETMDAVSALALYFDFKELAPVGRRGDEIVRKLADRLVELDLLDQAGELLQYQVDRRLTGVAKATVAARLAAIRLMSGKPLLALKVLAASRLADLPPFVRRFRFVLEARAQADLTRTDLALESIEGETGPDFDRLRTSILWSARRWREAGEAGEAMLGTRWQGSEPLSDRDRQDVLRAAIAFAAADERLALDRMKEKFGRKMMDSPDAASFGLLLRPGATTTREFRALAQEATKADGLKMALEDWKERRQIENAPPQDAALSVKPDAAAAPVPAPAAAGARG